MIQGNSIMAATEGASKRSRFLKRLMQDQSGNTLAMVAASVLPIVGIVGGAVDMGRGYMTKARLQQACDAGALATRKAMLGSTLSDTEKAVGYKYFDFNFPVGTYGSSNRVRTYVQPQTNASPPVPLPMINGTASVTVPTTLMRVFGNDSLNISVTCTSRQDVSHVDVSMVLDVTGSMNSSMVKSSTDNSTESRISALRRATKAFYDALGPGRAGGDPTKGRIRYAVVPYGTVANVGYLLHNNQMVDSWTYSSREPFSTPVYSWVEGSTLTKEYGLFSPAVRPSTVENAMKVYANYSSFSRYNNDITYTDINGNSVTRSRTITQVPKAAPATGNETATSANCYRANILTPGTNNTTTGLVDVAASSSDNETFTSTNSPPPVHPQSTRVKGEHTTTRTHTATGLRYRWFNVSGNGACRLEGGSGNSQTRWTQVATSPASSVPVTWTTHSGPGFVNRQRTIDVSGLKAGDSNWNSTITVPNFNASGGSTASVYLSGQDYLSRVRTGGTATSLTATWRGCVEERTMDNTIRSTTSISPLSANSYDLDVTRIATVTDDNTRWKPWLPDVFRYPDDSGGSSEECPAPAFKLQEIASYDGTVLSSPYPNLFDAVSGGASSYYYPYSSTAANNVASFKNYINRISLVDGTIHDSGFIWGLHLVSGQGMFASENPDYFGGTIVSRNIVFMTDGDINPGEDRYVYSGYNKVNGRIAPANFSDTQMKAVNNRRLRMLCEAAKEQGIAVWVVVINDGAVYAADADLRACATSASYFKSAATADELVQSFTTIAQSIGGLRLSQ
jgi:Flp pilus assembly protein TadG